MKITMQKINQIRNNNIVSWIGAFVVVTIISLLMFKGAHAADSVLNGSFDKSKAEFGEGSDVQKYLYAGAGFVGVITGLMSKNWVAGISTFVITAIFVFVLNSTVLS